MDYSELVDKVGNMHSRIVEEFLGESVRTRVTVDETVIEFVGVSPIYEDPFGTQGMDDDAPEPTVTLYGTSGNAYEYRSITGIRGNAVAEVRGVWRPVGSKRAWNEAAYFATVAASAADITIAAREAWGADWSCPGAEPPVVVLPTFAKDCPMEFSHITHIEPRDFLGGTFCQVWGSGRYGGGFWHGRHKKSHAEGWGILLPVEKAIAACAAAGVPCPQEEKPEIFVGVDPAAEGGDKSVTVILERQPSGEVCVVGIEKPEPAIGIAIGVGELVHVRQDGMLYAAADPRIAKLQKRVDGLELAATTAREAWVGEEARADNAEKRVVELEELAEQQTTDWLGMRDERDSALGRIAELEKHNSHLAEVLSERSDKWRAQRNRVEEVERDIKQARSSVRRSLQWKDQANRIREQRDEARKRVRELEAERFELLDERGNLKSRLGGRRKRVKELEQRIAVLVEQREFLEEQAVSVTTAGAEAQQQCDEAHAKARHWEGRYMQRKAERDEAYKHGREVRKAKQERIAELEKRLRIKTRAHDLAATALTAVCKRMETDWRAMRIRVISEAVEELREKDAEEPRQYLRDSRNPLQEKLDAQKGWRETETCGYCHGSGMVVSKLSPSMRVTCVHCRGTGLVVKLQPPSADASPTPQEPDVSAGDDCSAE